MTTLDIFSPNVSHVDSINEFRIAMNNPALTDCYSNTEMLNFLRARRGDIELACKMLREDHQWRSHMLSPVQHTDFLCSPNICLAHPVRLDRHAHKHLLPVAHHGSDKDGRPIYWEKTGLIQSKFSELSQQFSGEDLLFFHIQSQEGFELRLNHASRKLGRSITQCVVIFDLACLSYVLDMGSITYIKNMLSIDQMHYPEKLFRLYIINTPWFFSAMFNIFKPFIDAKTADKVVFLGANYLDTLQKQIDISQIPDDYGGSAGSDCCWSGPFHESSGISPQQVQTYLEDRYSEQKIDTYLTPEEKVAFYECVLEDVRLGNLSVPSEQLDVMRSFLGRDDTMVEGSVEHDVFGDNRTGRTPMDLSLHFPGDAVGLIPEPNNTPEVLNQRVISNVSRISIIGAQIEYNSTPSFVFYRILVQCGQNKDWQVLRRYSEFSALRRKLVSQPDYKNICSIPRKVLFARKSASVVSKRIVGLGNFLSEAVDLAVAHGGLGEMLITEFLRMSTFVDAVVEADADQAPDESAEAEAEERVVSRRNSILEDATLGSLENRRNRSFMKDHIDWWVTILLLSITFIFYYVYLFS